MGHGDSPHGDCRQSVRLVQQVKFTYRFRRDAVCASKHDPIPESSGRDDIGLLKRVLGGGDGAWTWSGLRWRNPRLSTSIRVVEDGYIISPFDLPASNS